MVNKHKLKGMTTRTDTLIGQRLRLARTSAGMSQQTLAKLTGVTYQQIQKYESGKNRIAASRLLQFAGMLEKSVEWFYEPAINAAGKGKKNIFAEEGKDSDTAIDYDERRIYRYGKIINDIPNLKAQRLLLALAKEVRA